MDHEDKSSEGVPNEPVTAVADQQEPVSGDEQDPGLHQGPEPDGTGEGPTDEADASVASATVADKEEVENVPTEALQDRQKSDDQIVQQSATDQVPDEDHLKNDHQLDEEARSTVETKQESADVSALDASKESPNVLEASGSVLPTEPADTVVNREIADASQVEPDAATVVPTQVEQSADDTQTLETKPSDVVEPSEGNTQDQTTSMQQEGVGRQQQQESTHEDRTEGRYMCCVTDSLTDCRNDDPDNLEYRYEINVYLNNVLVYENIFLCIEKCIESYHIQCCANVLPLNTSGHWNFNMNNFIKLHRC